MYHLAVIVIGIALAPVAIFVLIVLAKLVLEVLSPILGIILGLVLLPAILTLRGLEALDPARRNALATFGRNTTLLMYLVGFALILVVGLIIPIMWVWKGDNSLHFFTWVFPFGGVCSFIGGVGVRHFWREIRSAQTETRKSVWPSRANGRTM